MPSLEEVWADAEPPRRPKWKAPNPEYASSKLKVIDPLILADKPLPRRQWLVDGWIPMGNVTMLGGDGGVGKSLLAQQLASAVSTGGEWLGQATKACRALCIFCEDDADELHRRQHSINERQEQNFGDLENLQWASRIGLDNSMMIWEQYEASGQPTEFFQQISNAAQDFGAQLIILDSLHDLFAGNENSRVHARQFIQLLASLARDCDGAVVLCSHPSVAGRTTGSGESGSTAWNNAVRSRLYLTRTCDEEGNETDQYQRTLRRMKANYASVGEGIQLRWEDGVFIPEMQSFGILGRIEDGALDDVFLACLDTATEQGRHVTDSQNSPRYAPKIFAPMPRAEGAKRHQLERAMNRLFDARKIRVGDIAGPDRHPIKAIVRESE